MTQLNVIPDTGKESEREEDRKKTSVLFLLQNQEQFFYQVGEKHMIFDFDFDAY